MANSPKPFPCQLLGCKLSFTTEDHLAAHTRRHELDKLELPCKAGLFADKTPTPTRTVDRLLKNCDAVGLFEDLQNVNPFEETFRKAVENKISINLSTDDSMKILAEVATAEDLNTPNYFPTTSTKATQQDSKASSHSQPVVGVVRNSVVVIPPAPPPPSRKRKFPKILPKPSTTDLTKDKLKAFLLKEPLEVKLEPDARITEVPKLKSRRGEVLSADPTRQRAIQNREAAKRYRKNKKARQTKLEEENEELKRANEDLKLENKELRRVIAHLKAKLQPKVKEAAKPVCILLPVSGVAKKDDAVE